MSSGADAIFDLESQHIPWETKPSEAANPTGGHRPQPEDRLAGAAAAIEGGGSAPLSLLAEQQGSGDISWPLQKAAVQSWAQRHGLLIRRTLVSGCELFGREHEVLPVAGGRRFIKVGHDWGNRPEVLPDGRWALVPSSPAEYLARMKSANQLLGDDIILHGVLDRGAGRIVPVISQPGRVGGAPTPDEIQDWMSLRGFVSIGDHAYYRTDLKILVADAGSNNFVKTEVGLVPIDVLICSPESVPKALIDWSS